MQKKWSYLKYSQLRIPSYKDGASLLSQGSIEIEKKLAVDSSADVMNLSDKSCQFMTSAKDEKLPLSH